jgi:RNA polymerase sigma factor (sigma-70 family)
MPPMSSEVEPSDRTGSESIETLFAALESPLLSYALRLVGERGKAEDVVQEAFMKLHVNFTEVREPRRWLYRTVHNLSLNHRRKEQKLVALPQASDQEHRETPDPEPQPDQEIVRAEGIGLVRLTMDALDKRSRDLVRLKFDDNLSYKEISERTGLTVTHVGYLLHHALKTIGAELARTGLVP